jgi:polyhydroxyalkanoate synthesis regulator phasin
MLDLLRRATLAGIGALTLTEERARKLVDELVEQGRMSQEEGEGIIREMMAKTEASREEWEDRLRDMVQEVFRKMDLVPRKDLELVEEQLRLVEKRLAELEHRDRDRSEEIPV